MLGVHESGVSPQLLLPASLSHSNPGAIPPDEMTPTVPTRMRVVPARSKASTTNFSVQISWPPTFSFRGRSCAVLVAASVQILLSLDIVVREQCQLSSAEAIGDTGDQRPAASPSGSRSREPARYPLSGRLYFVSGAQRVVPHSARKALWPGSAGIARGTM